MSRVFLALALVAIVAIAGVDARSHRHNRMAPPKPVNLTNSHSGLMNAPADDAFFAKIHADLKARNYTRPQSLGASAYGVDISQWCGEQTWACLKNAGYSFAIVRAGCSNGQVDGNGVHSVANAWAAGMKHVDIYLFPCFNCGASAATQVANTINNMGSIPFGMIWMDIEAAGSGWSGNAAANHAWLVAAINQAASMIGKDRIGIYSSAYGWSVAMGGYSDLTAFPLWYAHYDNNPSFSDWSSFGGWGRPAMKQYVGDATVCGFGVDLNCW